MSTSRFTFVVCLLTCFLNCSTATEVTAVVGHDVILHCHGHKDADIELLQWIKPDLNSDDYVFFFRENHRYEHYQHPSFHGRVTLRDPTMTDGDTSVILRKVTMKDTGTYQCHVGKRSSQRSKRSAPELINTIILKVEDSEHKHLTVNSGDRVTLPCRGFSNSTVTGVEWIRPDLEGYVFMFQDGRSVPDEQHQHYKNRVELKDTEMKDGDVSLILKNVKTLHSGTYHCYVNQRGTNNKRDASDRPISIIDLTVEPGNTGGHKGDGDNGEKQNKDGGNTTVIVVVVLVLLLVAGLTVLIIKWAKQRNWRKLKL